MDDSGTFKARMQKDIEVYLRRRDNLSRLRLV